MRSVIGNFVLVCARLEYLLTIDKLTLFVRTGNDARCDFDSKRTTLRASMPTRAKSLALFPTAQRGM